MSTERKHETGRRTTDTGAMEADMMATSVQPGEMRAMAIRRYGDPTSLEPARLAVPEPGPGEALVRVRAAGVNPAETYLRQGRFRRVFRLRFPFVLGSDLAGEVVVTGSGVTRVRTGDAVYAMSAADKGGGYAEFAVVPEEQIARMPANLTFVEAAAIPLAALTALQALRDKGQLRADERALIVGASGGVGTFAVQLAVAFGARVTAVCGAGNRDLVLGLGAERAIDYAREDYTREGGRYDLIFDAVGEPGFRRARRALTDRGRYVTVVPSPAYFALQALTRWWPGRRIAPVFVRPRGADLDALRALVEAGRVRPVIDRTYPLADAAQAHAYSETRRARGKLVLLIDE